MIVEKESVKISQNGIDKLIEGKNLLIKSECLAIISFLVAGGDMRRAITYLQSLHRLNPDEIVPNDVFEIAAMCDDEKVDGIIKAAQEISFDKMITKAKELLLVRDHILNILSSEPFHPDRDADFETKIRFRMDIQHVNSFRNYWIKSFPMK